MERFMVIMIILTVILFAVNIESKSNLTVVLSGITLCIAFILFIFGFTIHVIESELKEELRFYMKPIKWVEKTLDKIFGVRKNEKDLW